MQPEKMFCSNADCPSCGQAGKGNIIWHHRKKGRLKCNECGKTFSKDKGTPFFGLRKCRGLLTIIITLVVHGCPVTAIVKAFGLDSRTVYRLLEKGGAHCGAVHGHLVERPLGHGQVQADEICANIQGGRAWVAMAIAVGSRLWLGASVGRRRTKGLIDSLAGKVRRCTDHLKPLLITTDGLSTYVKSFRKAMDLRIGNGQKGRPKRVENPNFVLAQCVKGYVKKGKRFVCKGFTYCRIASGSFCQLAGLIKETQPTALLNTAYIERLNASFRQAINGLCRRGRCILRGPSRLCLWVYLKGTVYNFCQPHQSLGQGNTPAMQAGITKHVWSINELLVYRVPPPLWIPSKRGRRSRKDWEIIQKWRPDLATS